MAENATTTFVWTEQKIRPRDILLNGSIPAGIQFWQGQWYVVLKKKGNRDRRAVASPDAGKLAHWLNVRQAVPVNIAEGDDAESTEAQCRRLGVELASARKRLETAEHNAEEYRRQVNELRNERFDDRLPPGGMVCATCGTPVESEPCREHSPQARLERAEARAAMLRPEVWLFALAMERKLRVNSGKSSWKGEDVDYFTARVRQEWMEVLEELRFSDGKNLLAECADVANFLMMICDIRGALACAGATSRVGTGAPNA